MKHAGIVKFILAAVVMFAVTGALAKTETVDGLAWNYTVSDGKEE